MQEHYSVLMLMGWFLILNTHTCTTYGGKALADLIPEDLGQMGDELDLSLRSHM